MPEHLQSIPPPPPPPGRPPYAQGGSRSLSEAQVAALKLVLALAAVVAIGLWLLFQDGGEDADLAELRELAAGGGVTQADESGLPASLWVDADPIGSTVYIDGDSAGTTPLWIESLAAGDHRVRVLRPDGTGIDTVLAVSPGQMAELDAEDRARPTDTAVAPVDIAEAEPTPEPPAQTRSNPQQATTGEIRVLSSPTGAVVLVDGRRVGTTPVALSGLRPGSRTVTVARGGYETSVREIEVRPGVQYETVVDLRPVAPAPAPTPRRVATPAPATPAPAPTPAPQEAPAPVTGTGTVEILVRPWGRISIDGTVRQRETDIVYRTTLSAGLHRIEVSHPQLGSDSRTVTVQPGGESRIEFDLAND